MLRLYHFNGSTRQADFDIALCVWTDKEFQGKLTNGRHATHGGCGNGRNGEKRVSLARPSHDALYKHTHHLNRTHFTLPKYSGKKKKPLIQCHLHAIML